MNELWLDRASVEFWVSWVRSIQWDRRKNDCLDHPHSRSNRCFRAFTIEWPWRLFEGDLDFDHLLLSHRWWVAVADVRLPSILLCLGLILYWCCARNRTVDQVLWTFHYIIQYIKMYSSLFSLLFSFNKSWGETYLRPFSAWTRTRGCESEGEGNIVRRFSDSSLFRESLLVHFVHQQQSELSSTDSWPARRELRTSWRRIVFSSGISGTETNGWTNSKATWL